MPAVHFEPLDALSVASCDLLAGSIATGARCASDGENDAPDLTVFVADTLDDAGAATVLDRLGVSPAAPASCVLVYREAAPHRLRPLLAAGLLDALPQDEHTATCLQARLRRLAALDEALARGVVSSCLPGRSAAWQSALGVVAETALFSSAPLLICGPTGTGKELLARLLHTLDPRADKGELVTVDCTQLTRELAASELFGHERGAFTGAVGERSGAVAAADRGTLFLDEIGELAVDVQAGFLRVLQEQAFRRVGGTRWHRSRFRLVCATNRDLAAEACAGRFRPDLFHRLSANVCRTAALADRREDVPLLVRHFVDQELGRAGVPLAPLLLEHLCARDYPGNVRELQQLVRACLRRYPGTGPLSPACLPPEEWRRVTAAAAPPGAAPVAEPVPQPGPPPTTRPASKATAGDAPAPPADPGEPADSTDPDAPDPATATADGLLLAYVRTALREGAGLREIGRRVEAAAVRIALEETDSVTRAATRLGVTARALHLRRAAERRSTAP